MLPLLFYPDPSLKTPCYEVKEVNEEIKQFCDELVKTMYALRGQGLAAPQVGRHERIFVIVMGKANHQVCINPEIVDLGGDKIKANEGCLSLPGVVANLHCRYERCTLKGLNQEGEEISLMLSGMEAVAAQHEYDHMSGKTIFDLMGSAQRQLKKKKYLRWHKKFKKAQREAEKNDKNKALSRGTKEEKKEANHSGD